MASKKITKSGLTTRQEQFCQLYVSQEFFANGVQAYCEAFNVDLTKPGKYNAAKTSAYELLTNPDILKRINELLDLGGLNDEFVDKQLLFTMTQNADLGAKVAAMREYNKLKSRITEKMKVEHSGNISGIKIEIVDPTRSTENPKPEGE